MIRFSCFLSLLFMPALALAHGSSAEDGQPAVSLAKTSVLVDAHVDKMGRTTEAHVVKASGSKDADAKAIAAVMQWHFKPAMVQGKPTDAHVRIPVIIESNVTGAASDDASHLGKS